MAVIPFAYLDYYYPQEAKVRIDSLSDAVVNDIVNKLDELQAGGGSD
jgi:hypothetical protein